MPTDLSGYSDEDLQRMLEEQGPVKTAPPQPPRVPSVPTSTNTIDTYDTKLSPVEESQFKTWKTKFAPQDSGADYDLRGAFKSGLKPDAKTGHWPDTFKKPNHPTFSNESKYAAYGNPGRWEGEKFIPPEPTPTNARDLSGYSDQELEGMLGDSSKYIWEAHKANLAAGEKAEQRVRNVETAGNILGGIMRGGSMLLGPAGAAAGQLGAEAIEQAGRGVGPTAAFGLGTAPRAAISAGLSAIPGGSIAKPIGKYLGGPLSRAAEEALLGAGSTAATAATEGRIPSLGELGVSAAAPAILGPVARKTGRFISGRAGALPSSGPGGVGLPERGMNKLQRAILGDKPPQSEKAIQRASRLADDLKGAIPVLQGKNIKTKADLSLAAENAIKATDNQYQNNILAPFRDYTVDGSTIADKMIAGASRLEGTPLEKSASVAKIKELADSYRRPISLGELEDLKVKDNALMQSFYEKGGTAQEIAENIPAIAGTKNQVEAVRDLLYTTLDRLHNDVNTRDLLKTRGNLEGLNRHLKIDLKGDALEKSIKGGKTFTVRGAVGTGIKTASSPLETMKQFGVRWSSVDPKMQDYLIKRGFKDIGDIPIKAPVPPTPGQKLAQFPDSGILQPYDPASEAISKWEQDEKIRNMTVSPFGSAGPTPQQIPMFGTPPPTQWRPEHIPFVRGEQPELEDLGGPLFTPQPEQQPSLWGIQAPYPLHKKVGQKPLPPPNKPMKPYNPFPDDYTGF